MHNACIAVLAFFALSAQAQDVSRVYHFANTQAPAGFQEVVTCSAPGGSAHGFGRYLERDPADAGHRESDGP